MQNETLIASLHKARHIIFFAMLYILILILSAVFFYRYIDIDHILLPGGIFVYPILYIITDIIAELYGYSISRLFIWYGIACNFIFGISAFLLTYTPTVPGTEFAHDYSLIFRDIIRLNLGNCIGSLVGGFLNIYLLSKWKIILHGRFFMLRSITSNLFGELIMLTITGAIVLVGKLPLHKIISLLAADYGIRIIFCIVLTGPAALYVAYVKKKENIDVFDISTKFNPFKIGLEEQNPVQHKDENIHS